jgi:hypothetical protein
MTRADFDRIKDAYKGNQLYWDTYENLGWSWLNYRDLMFEAVGFYAKGNKGYAFTRVKASQAHNPDVQKGFDLALQLFDEAFWLFVMTSGGGKLNWEEINGIIGVCYRDNLSGLEDANKTWGPNLDGPQDLPTTLAAVAKLMVATIPANGIKLLFENEVWAALRTGFAQDPVQLFAFVHTYLPLP